VSARTLALAAAGALVAAAAVADAAPRRSLAAGFAIAGRAAGSLAPGRSRPIDLRLTNRHPFALRVTSLSVSVSAAGRPGCAPRANFATRPYSGRPFVVPAKAARTLGGLRIPRWHWPRVTMRDTAAPQNACAGAGLTLRYTGAARRAR
jgi:hypothetical protein